MFKLKHKKLLSRGMYLLFTSTMFVGGLEDLLKLNGAVIRWTAFIFLLTTAGVFFVMPLDFMASGPSNRWYRAAYWAFWILCTLVGVLFIGAAAVWGIIESASGEFPALDSLLVLIAIVLVLVGILLVGGLGIIGLIAQVHEETR
jgi:hypothetical protein